MKPVVVLEEAAEDIEHARNFYDARERGIGEILISISHCRTYATAYALALGRPAGNGQVNSPPAPS